jgi:hypothetical protein
LIVAGAARGELGDERPVRDNQSGASLAGVARVTASTPDHSRHLSDGPRIPLVDEDDAYERNIQIADLSALNAVLAVINWKKLCGFYRP